MNETTPISSHSDQSVPQMEPAHPKSVVWEGETVEKLKATDLDKVSNLDVVPLAVAAILKDVHASSDLKLKAAHFLSKLEGGYEDADLKVKRGWEGTAATVSVVFKNTFRTLARGGSGTIDLGKTQVIDTKAKRVSEPTEFVRKTADTKEQFEKMVQGDEVVKFLEEKYGEGAGLSGLVHSFKSIDPDSNSVIMHAYQGHIDHWQEEHQPAPKVLLQAYEPAIRTLGIMQKEGVVHLDIKSQNLLAKAGDPVEFVIGDFDGVFKMPQSDDPRSHQELIEYLDKALFKSDGSIHNPEFTPEFTPRSEVEHLKPLFDALRKRDPPPSKEEILSISAEISQAVRKIQVYQMGCSIIGLITDGTPITDLWDEDRNPKSRFEYVLPGYVYGAIRDTEGIPEALKVPFTDFLVAMTDPDPNNRITAVQAEATLKGLIQQFGQHP